MKPWYKKTERLKPKPPYMMIKPSRFFSCRFSIRLINGYMTAWNGTSMAAVNIKSRTLEKRVWFLTIIQAEREETTTKRATEVRVTRAVIAKAFQKLICSAAPVRWPKSQEEGSARGALTISGWVLKELISRKARGERV